MRLKFILPMLLFVGSLAAQNNCLITSLTATVISPNPGSCQYYVVLAFLHTGTTNQFTVTGNGNTYGTYPYTHLPVQVGPFTAMASVTHKEFVVTDAVLQDCHASVSVDIPACSLAACNIHDLSVVTGTCDPTTNTYDLYLKYGVTNPSDSTVDVYAGNGTLLGNYPISTTPIHILHFPWGGGALDAVKVCVHNNNDCCTSTQFAPPACILSSICIQNLTVTTDGCTSDSTYRAIINFQTIAPIVTDSFLVYANGNYFGTYAYNSLPLTINNFPYDGGTTDYVKICLKTPVQPQINLCCAIKEYTVPDCLPIFPCSIKNLTATVGPCTSDSTFKVTINFMVKDSTQVDSFDVYGSTGHIGRYGLNQLPLTISNFPWNHQVYNVFYVCTGGTNMPGCCRSLKIVAPNCLPFGPCEISAMNVTTGPCTSDTTYRVILTFQASNPGNGTFTVYENGDTLGVFPLTSNPLTIPNFHWSGNPTDIITVCINGASTPGAVGCCLKKEFNVPDCLHPKPCSISNLTATPGPCDPNAPTFSLVVNFSVQNPGNTSFDLYAGNNVLLGTFPIAALPLTIPNFPAVTGTTGHIRVCINDHPNCCAEVNFTAPNCGPCAITNLHATIGDCTSDSTYAVTVNFSAVNPPSGSFQLYANGNLFGTYNISQLPLSIPNFPWNGANNNYIKVCFVTPAGSVTCCAATDFAVPNCIYHPCVVQNLAVETGDCTGDSSYVVKINFSVTNPPPSDSFMLFANGTLFGTFNINQLPLTINHFPWNGQPINSVRVCFVFSTNPPQYCCETKEFPVPTCLPQACLIENLTVVTGDCTSDSTYVVTINFTALNPLPGNIFAVYDNGVLFGTYNLTQLPLVIANFHWNGANNNVIRVCMTGVNVPPTSYTCCAIKEFPVPSCLFHGPCDIHDLTAVPGNCEPNGTYHLTINFGVNNPPSTTFGVWANGTFFGTYNLNQLPLTIPNYPWDSAAVDFVKVCFSTNGAIGCCATKEFQVPPCVYSGSCAINDLTAVPGDCTGDSTYVLKINFIAVNPPSSSFVVFANGTLFGTYNLSQLPLTITNFPWNGGAVDVVKVCFPNSTNISTCCATKEFQVPTCLGQSNCSINNLHAVVGDCTSDSTYNLTINFSVNNPIGTSFGVWANGNFLGIFNLSQLPLTIPNFPWNGSPVNTVKVCFGNAGVVTCCAVAEFHVPTCLTQGGPCEVLNLKVDTGGCTGDSLYSVTINFTVNNPPSNAFQLYANGSLFGTYSLNQLPLTIPNFPWNGGVNDVVKVCIVPGPNIVACCAIKEFPVPTCLFNNPCGLGDLHVIKTKCLCGKFFAIVWFTYQTAGSGGYDVYQNGNLLGNFPYNTPQPLILGEFLGDSTTHYEFTVKDHNHPDCHTSATLGTVNCGTTPAPVINNYGSNLIVSPNPAGDWMHVNLQMTNGAKAGQTIVDIIQADGRLVKSISIGDGNDFQIDVSYLPSGIYRLMLRTEAGRFETSFAKQ
jgi:hypothetical protein